MIKVLVADDHAVVRAGLTQLLDATGDIQVVGSCADGDEVAGAADVGRPDVVLMDLRMPRVDGITAARLLLRARPEVRVLMLTATSNAAAFLQARDAGCRGLVSKSQDPAELLSAIREVAAGRTAWCPDANAAFLTGGVDQSVTLRHDTAENPGPTAAT